MADGGQGLPKSSACLGNDQKGTKKNPSSTYSAENLELGVECLGEGHTQDPLTLNSPRTVGTCSGHPLPTLFVTATDSNCRSSYAYPISCSGGYNSIHCSDPLSCLRTSRTPGAISLGLAVAVAVGHGICLKRPNPCSYPIPRQHPTPVLSVGLSQFLTRGPFEVVRTMLMFTCKPNIALHTERDL